jgi:two-component system response regulator MprA
MRVLVVDDDTAVRDSLARTLRFEGHEVDTARDGQEALEAVHAGEPDAMILDVSMPRVDGLETCRRLRADGKLLPVLMLTARDSVGDRVAGLDANRSPYRNCSPGCGRCCDAPPSPHRSPRGRSRLLPGRSGC